jgi:hypothetical protein
MEEEKEKQMNVEVVDTIDEPVENEQPIEERVPENKTRTTTPTDTMEEELAPLFEGDEAKKFRSRWLAIQSKFVDDPSASVKQADDLVSDVIKSVTMNFSNRRIALEKQWNGEENTSTEDLRLAIKRYRSFFDRLLTLES